MNPYKSRKIARIIAIIIVVVMVVTSITALGVIGFGNFAYGEDGTASRDAYLDAEAGFLKEYIKYIQREYKDTVDYELLMKGAFAGVVDVLDDPYSEYYIDTEAGQRFLDGATGTFEGVGLSFEDYMGSARVVSAIPGTPAGRAGIKSGDVIVKVDGVSVAGTGASNAVRLIKGEKGSKVEITVERGGAELSFTLTREVIHTMSVEGKLLDGGIGYIRISSFDEDSDVEFRDAKARLAAAGAKSFIIDLRDNPGGVVATVLKIANQLMPAGPITHYMRQDVIIESHSADGAAYDKAPLALLVNKGSASGSEILAAALQDSKAATLVGETTYGKGVAQVMMGFPNGGMMKFSTFYFLSPDKKQINQVGVKPDYVVASPEAKDNGALLSLYLSFAPMREQTKPSLGAVGLNVYGAQQRLAFLGYDVETTGVLDGGTAYEVSRFQGNMGMYAYGELDYSTMAKLDEACKAMLAGTATGADAQLAKAIEIIKAQH
ncbi:MAG: PDZ domain-containing protein [Clostridiales Family XIII bacterium]|jgi:carboxyl-terminal processing protease|nr:PDZ domain-containing protein [Clostridiales Family XIII bacterium]